MAEILSSEYVVFTSVSALVKYCGMECKGDVSNGTKVFKKLVKYGYLKKEKLVGKHFIVQEPSYLEFLEYRIKNYL